MSKKIGEINYSDVKIVFTMHGERLIAIVRDQNFHVKDSDILEENLYQSSQKRWYINGETIGLEAGRKILIPVTVLRTMDIVRRLRQTDDERKRFKFIFEAYEKFGLVEYTMMGTAFLIWYEGQYTVIEDKEIVLTDQGYRIPSKLKDIPVPYLYIQESVLKQRDEIRAKIEYESHFKPIGESNGIKFFLNDDDNLVMRYGDKEAIASEIENIYGKPAVKAESLELGHPYISVPIQVEDAVIQARSKKLPEGLQLVPAGTSVLDGKIYHRFDKEIPEAAFNRVQLWFKWFGENTEDNLNGWLTSDPEKVMSTLNLN